MVAKQRAITIRQKARQAASNFRHDLSMYRHSMHVQLRAVMMLRGAFITQIFGMIFNNLCFLAAWLFFFHHFGSVNGWTAADFIGLSGVSAFVYGLVFLLATGMRDVPNHVDTGSLDSFLTKPTSVLGNLASSNIDATTLGDLLFGAVLIIWYAFQADAGIGAVLLFLIALFTACMSFFCFAVLLPNIIAFYVFDSAKLSRYSTTLFVDSGLYPSGVLNGALRAILLIGIPSLLYAAVPTDVLRGLHWEWAGLGLLVAVLWLAISLWLFRRALRKYESANLIGAR